MAKYPVRTPPSRLKRATGNSGLFGGAGGTAPPPTPPTTDPNFASTKLLLGFEGVNGATSTIDESAAARGTSSRSGTAVIDTSQSKFGTASLAVVANDAFTFPASTDFDLAAGSFTVECFIKLNDGSALTRCVVSRFGSGVPNLGYTLYLNSKVPSWNVSTTGSDNLVDLTGGLVTVGVWSALCVDYDGSKYRLYQDGIMVASSTTPRTIFAPNKPLALGTNSDGALPFNGWIDEVRITKGVARYASDGGYTVPTSAFPRS